MNAGLKGQEIFNNLLSVKFADGYGQKSEIEHGYRYAKLGGIALEAVFEVKNGYDEVLYEELKNARKNQPKNPSAGSCFKNPPNNFAGKLIEEAGMKGYQIGGMAFSEVHANFLVNLGDGKVEDALEIIELAQKKVFENSGIKLELEVKIV
jgi:UDP-N-acetylmuramate dehydrogenase